MENHVVDQWQTQLTKISELEPYHVPGVGHSFPVLAQKNGNTVVRYFYHYADQVGPNSAEIGAPYVKVELAVDDFSLLALVSEDAFDLESFEAYEYELQPRDRNENKRRIARLKNLYDTLVERYPDQPSGQAGKDFLYVLEQIVPNPLMPYYKNLSPEFFTWLEA